jgi:hypothetical protein
MRIELTSSQRDVLLELVNEALRDLGPEIHHARTPSYKENLREFRHDLSALRGLLNETGSAHLVGSP